MSTGRRKDEKTKAKRRKRKDEKTKAKRRKDESEKDEKTKAKRRKDEKTKAKRRKDEIAKAKRRKDSEKTLNSGLCSPSLFRYFAFVISLCRFRYFVYVVFSLFRLFVFSLSSFRLFVMAPSLCRREITKRRNGTNLPPYLIDSEKEFSRKCYQWRILLLLSFLKATYSIHILF